MTRMTDKRKHPTKRNANPVRIRPEEIRAAREGLGLSRLKLARLAAVPFPELSAFERDGRKLDRDSLRRIRRVLECGGVDFVGPPVFPGLIAYFPDRIRVIVMFGASHKLARARR